MSDPRDPAAPDPSPDLPPPGGDAADAPFAPPAGSTPTPPPTEAMAATPPPGDPTPPASPLPPTEAIPTTPGSGVAPGAAAVGAAGAARTGPGVPPPGAPPHDTAVGFDDERPWWKSPAGIFSILVGLLLAGGLLAWLIWGGGGDDDSAPDPQLIRLELTAVDPSGTPLERAFIGTVTGPSDAPDYLWVLPSGGDGVERGGSTDADGVITFAWEPDETVEEPADWESRISLIMNSPAGATPPGPTIDCVLERLDEQPATISMSAAADPPDTSVEQLVALTFPNHVFLPGDLVRCELVSIEPGPTTTAESTTTVPETTTTDATTTTVVETTTTVAPTTVAPTTAAPTTAAPTTAAPTTTTAPAQPATVREALVADGRFATFLSLVDQVTSVSDLLDGPGPITVFAPTDDALAGITPPTGDELEQLLLAHIVDGEALDAATLFDGRTEITVADDAGTVHAVDAANQTVGGITMAVLDLLSDSGVSHGIDSVLAPTGP